MATPTNLQSTDDKLVIFDDDQSFGTLIGTMARQSGFVPTCVTSLLDLGSFARLKSFDIAIIDYYLGSWHGDEIAEYVDTFFAHVPVIIVSSEDFNARTDHAWPASVRLFVQKTEGARAIIAAARQVLDRDRMLKRLAAPSGSTSRWT